MSMNRQRIVILNGAPVSLRQACTELGVSYHAVYDRSRKKGETPEESLEYYCTRDNKTMPDLVLSGGGLTAGKKETILRKIEEAMNVVQDVAEFFGEKQYTEFIDLMDEVQEMIEG